MKTRKRRGISLMVLIITIIVVIILAAAVILTLSKNNPLTSAKEATFKSDIRNFQEDLAMYISNQILKDYYGNRSKITTSEEPNLDEMKQYISSFTSKYEEKLGIEDDELVYFANKVTETEKKRLDDLGIKPAGYTIAEASEECFIWNGNNITGYYEDKLKEYLAKTNGVLKIPKRCYRLSSRVFEYNSLIEHVILQEGLQGIDYYVFRSCVNLKTIYISETVEWIAQENGANFIGCPELISINVSEENKKYSSQDGILYDKNKTKLIVAPGTIETCKIPDTVKIIEEWAFKGCKNLKEVEIPEGVQTIEMRAFEDCTLLTNIDLPSTLTEIASYVFYNTNLTGTVIIPDNVKYLGTHLFSNCKNISKIVIGNKVETIGGDSSMIYHAFNYCSSLTEFEVKEGNDNFSSQDGILYNKDKTKLILAPYGIKLDGISILNSVKEIGEYAFYGCVNITGSLYIPEGVTTIGAQSFSQIGISGGVTIPSSVTNLSRSAFSNSANITELNVDENNETYSSQDGILYTKDKSVVISAPQGLKLNNLVLPVEVKTIQSLAFYHCTELTGTLTLNEGLETIEGQSFSGCSNLNGQLIIPSTVKKIDYSAFTRNGFEGEVIIPSSVEEIGNQIFYECSGLTKINCEALSKPDSWSSGWNSYCNAEVVWGYTGE